MSRTSLWTRFAAVFLAGLLLAAAGPTRAPDPATSEMVARLAKLAAEADPNFNTFLNGARAERLRSLPAPAAPADQVRYHFALGSELLLDGQNLAAIESLQKVMKLLGEQPLGFDAAFVEQAQSRLALAFLRLGEEENCITAHNIDRCLLPIRGSGVHSVERGSRAAIRAYYPLLQANPDQLGYRWLVNLAFMTLGKHPEAVPPELLIPPTAFASDYQLGRFDDVAPELGLDAFGLSGGSVMEDFDGDGLLDLMISGWGLDEQIRLFRNLGGGRFAERTAEVGLTGLTGGLNLVQADYDNDGHIDVLVLRGAWLRSAGHHPNSLLRNLGGRFVDVTAAAGLLSFHPTQAAAWGDYDNDGWVDLFIGNEHLADDPHRSELYRNNGDGTFTDQAAVAGVEVGAYVKGTGWGDYDNDGRIDLFVSNMSSPNRLFRNLGPDSEGRWRFSDATVQAGVAEPLASFPAWFWDYDNDGWEDLLVSGYKGTLDDLAAEYLGRSFVGERPRLYRNNGDGTFTDRARQSGLDTLAKPMGCNFGDLDNDGWLDFYFGTGDTELSSLMPNRMFRNAGGERFQDVTTSGGFGHLQKGHGVSFGDLDNDGDQDIYAVMGGAHSGDGFHNALFENPGHGSHWITLRLVGESANRSAIGARIEVVVEVAGQKGGTSSSTSSKLREIHRTVGSGGSFGASPLRQEIGLGEAARIIEVKVRWPGSSEPQRLTGLDLDRFYELRQGRAPRRLELPSFTLGGSNLRGAAEAGDSHRHATDH